MGKETPIFFTKDLTKSYKIHNSCTQSELPIRLAHNIITNEHPRYKDVGTQALFRMNGNEAGERGRMGKLARHVVVARCDTVGGCLGVPRRPPRSAEPGAQNTKISALSWWILYLNIHGQSAMFSNIADCPRPRTKYCDLKHSVIVGTAILKSLVSTFRRHGAVRPPLHISDF